MDREKILSIENLETAFKRFDTNNSGKISSEELRTLLSSWDEAGKEDWQ